MPSTDAMVYSYSVSFSPAVEDKEARKAMINAQEHVLGKPSAFDGMTSLFMPKKLDEVATKVVSQHEGEPVEITITLVNEMAANSSAHTQLYNVLRSKLDHLAQ